MHRGRAARLRSHSAAEAAFSADSFCDPAKSRTLDNESESGIPNVRRVKELSPPASGDRLVPVVRPGEGACDRRGRVGVISE